YVADSGNARVQVFNTQGNFLRRWGVAGSLPSQFLPNTPQAIAASPNGWIYVNNGYQPNVITVFDSSGNYIKQRSDGSIASWVSEPASLAISPDGIWGYGYDLSSYGSISAFHLFDIQNTAVAPYIGTIRLGGFAFNKRGDVFAIIRQKLQIYEREYSSVQNPPTPPAMPEPVVLAVAQRTNTAWLDVDFKVVHAEASNVVAGALAFINGSNILSSAVQINTLMEGTAANLGTNVPANTNLRLTWNMGADWSIDYAQIQVEVLAKDSRNLMGFHWITVPSDGTNAAMQVSSAPVPDSELLSVWYWLIATHTPGMVLTNGAVFGSGGVFNGKVLASDSGTTAEGRTFAYGQMNVRAITTAEVTRANAGRYGFTSVTTDSVVKLP
ncbi:MAG: hypothetical protein NT154_39175, partial [Verrucomicrobia bacterium]|nr:hypothetical protein [Verrucomicrobiota bacterium]